MSSRAITERKDARRLAKRLRLPTEMAPSIVAEEQPLLPRILGGLGIALLVFAAVAIIALSKNKVLVLPMLSFEIGYGWAGFFGVIGLGLMLYHAARDAELQIRRSYMAFGYVWLLIGIGISVLPIQGPAGAQFLPKGLPAMVVAVFFLMAFVRNETEETFRVVAVYVLGAVGAAATVGGLFFGTIYESFLIPYGFVLCVLGIIYLSAFLALVGQRHDLGYLTGQAMVAIGAVVFLIAFSRSVYPALAQWRGWSGAGKPYFMPSGLTLMGSGLFYLCYGLCVVSDRPMVVMTRRELAAYFQTPIAYIILFGYAFLGWLMFLWFVKTVLIARDVEQDAYVAQTVQEPVILQYFIGWFQVISLIFLVPVLTMRLVSEEKRTGTLEMLLCAPVNEWQAVLSKFLAAWIIFILVWVPIGLFLIGLRVDGVASDGKSFDYRPLIGFYIALAMSGASMVAMGLFFSSLTRNQIAAAILTFAGMVFLTLLFFAGPVFKLDESLRSATEYVSYVNLWIKSCEGQLLLRDLIFHGSAAVFWLFLSVKVLEARKWL
jgi:ABC-type transport system involved in multi-copper enzyme maturation permease subunit